MNESQRSATQLQKSVFGEAAEMAKIEEVQGTGDELAGEMFH